MVDADVLSLGEMQALEFEMFCHLSEVCEKEGIAYCLLYGTALGAVRHAGFIPWDDDVDIGILSDEIDRLVLAINEDDSPYRVLTCFDDSSYVHPYAKLVDTRTRLEEPANAKVDELGIFVDLFPLYYLPDRRLPRRLGIGLFNMMQKLYCYRFVRRTEPLSSCGWRKSLAFMFAKFIFSKDDPVHYLKKMLGFLSRLTIGTGPYLASPYDCSLIIPAKWLFPIEWGVFCGRDAPLPGNSHAYLRSMYGDDYMLPIKTEHACHGVAYWRE